MKTLAINTLQSRSIFRPFISNIVKGLIIIGFMFSGLNSRAGNINHSKLDSNACLVVVGNILNVHDETSNLCKIELITYNSVTDSVLLKGSKKRFKFVLSKDMNYAIRISKKGYISKLVSIDTKFFTESDVLYVFEFTTDLIKEEVAKTLNQDVLELPVALIKFDYHHNCFSYNKEYTTQIKKELYASNTLLQ